MEQPWDAACMLSMLCRIRPQDHCSTNDVDGVGAAVALVQQGQALCKRVFVVTDGSSTRGFHLKKVLKDAELRGVDVLGIGVGMDEMNVQKVYTKFITAAVPKGVCGGLKQLFHEEGNDNSTLMLAPGSDSDLHSFHHLKDQLRSKDGGALRVEKILENAAQKFSKLQSKLNSQRQVKLIRGDSPGEIVVDLAFVIDCTGSMAPVLSIIKAQIIFILTGDKSIKSQLKHQFPQVELRFRVAVLGFRDVSDHSKFEALDFTENISAITDHLHGLRAEGGGDIAEDVPSALKEISQWKSWSGNARFVLLVTDAPCHGNSFHSGEGDNSPNNDEQSTTDFCEAFKQLLEKDICVLHCTCNPDATKLMHQRMSEILLSEHTTLEQNRRQNNSAQVLRDHTKYLTEVEMASAADIDSDLPPSDQAGVHVVFVLDESGSMSGQPFQELIRAYNIFLDRRLEDQAEKDVVSVVLFNADAREHQRCVPIANASRELPFRGGGTCFMPALRLAEHIIDSAPLGKDPHIVFMTDGCGSDNNETETKVTELKNKYEGRSFKFHAIAVGSVNFPTVSRFAVAAGPNGTPHNVQHYDDLTRVFAQIAAGTSASDVLFKAIGEKIGEGIQTKLIADFL